MKHKNCLALVLLAGVWMGAAMAQETSIKLEAGATTEEKRTQAAETLPSINATPSATSLGNERFSGVDWVGQQFWLVEMTDLLNRDAVTAAWRDLRARFPEQMQNRTVLPRRQDRIGNASEDPASQYQLFIAKFPEKQMAEEFCAMLRAGQQRCSVVPSDLLAGKNLLNAASASGDSGSGNNVSSAAEIEFVRVKAEQEAEEKARQEAEAKVAKLKAKQEAKQEAKAEAERLKAEQEAKAQAEKQALVEAKAEAVRLKAEQKAQAEAEKKAAAEEKARQVAEAKAEAARLKVERKAQAEAEKQAAAEAKKAAKAEAEKLKAEQEAQAAAEAESSRVKAGQEAEEKARQEAETKVAKLKAKQEAKAEAEKQALAEAKAEAARLKVEQKAQAEAEKKAEQEAQAAVEAESARAKAEQEAEEKTRQEEEARVAKLKAKQEAKAEAARLKAEQEAKALAEKQALAEAKAEAARLKAEKKAQAEAEKKAAAEEKARLVAEAKAEAARLKAEQKAQAEAEKQAAAEAKKAAKAEAVRLKTEQEAQAAAEAESARAKAEQEAEEKTRQEAEARVAKLKDKQEAKAEAARLKAEQEAKALAEKQALAEAKAEAARLKAEKKAQAEAEKQAAAEAKKTAKAEAARLKAEQKSKAETEKLAATANMQMAVVEPEALRSKAEVKQAAIAELEPVELKTGQKVQQYVPEDVEKKANVEGLAATETKQKPEAEVAQVNAEKKVQADVGGDAKATKPKPSEGTMEDFAQNVANTKAEQKSQEEAKAAKLKAAKSDMMVDFAQKAVLNSPDVLSRWHNFQAAISEAAAAEGAFYPQLDVTVDGGRERGMSTGSSYSVNTKTGTVTLTQLLYDGFATLNEVRRLNNAQLARYYELLDASETAALEAVRAFYDVSRQRKLFELTEDNYVRHRTAFEQIKLKVEAGVGRRVDLEQAAGRLALSESNLTLDNANVHDASARFQRIIGELPPTKIRKSPSQAKLAKKILPNAADALLSVAVESHPAILAAVENVRSSRYDLYGREAKYQPTVKLNVAQSHNKNMAGVDGTTGNASAKITLNWNLFSGGSDSARSAQYAKKLDAARDMRDKACRDIRMNLAIAYNDISKLKEQLNYMDQHQLSIEKARVAYQKQFEIGQRSLLDLLDTENELYQARRSYTNAEYDLAIAAARTHAGMGQLVSSLEISRLETADLPELLGVSSDAAENCPPEAPIANNIRKDELDARAIEEARAAIDASRAKEEAEKEKKAKEDEEFLMTPGEAKAAKPKQEEGDKATEDKTKQAAETGPAKAKPDGETKAEPADAAKARKQPTIPSTMLEFKEQGVEPGNGKSFKDCPNCPEMVMVPPGKFMMGSPGSQKQKAIDQPFATGKYEVTFAEWDACVAAGGCAKYRPDDQGWGRGRQPVVNVNWNDAKKYVGWLSQKTGKKYRLLTEAEWEYAARAGTTTAYPWGDAIGSGNANCNGCGSQWDNKRPAPVGSFKANAFGIHDMSGNVCEWTEECISNNNCNVRVIRGGSWFYDTSNLNSAYRLGDGVNARDYDDGFRVARELP